MAQRWFEQFEGAGLDGLIAKQLDLRYQPDKRVMSKIKHERTADCVVAGYRVHKIRPGRDRFAAARPVRRPAACSPRSGVIGAFPMARRKELFTEMQPLVTTFDGHPWNWAGHEEGERTPRKAETSRWNAGKDLSFVPLRPERVVEVRYDYMEGVRFRHTAQFVRWRPDRDPRVLHLRPAGPAGRLQPRRRPDERVTHRAGDSASSSRAGELLTSVRAAWFCGSSGGWRSASPRAARRGRPGRSPRRGCGGCR